MGEIRFNTAISYGYYIILCGCKAGQKYQLMGDNLTGSD